MGGSLVIYIRIPIYSGKKNKTSNILLIMKLLPLLINSLWVTVATTNPCNNLVSPQWLKCTDCSWTQSQGGIKNVKKWVFIRLGV